MGKSLAKKKRDKLVREGRRNPEENRSFFAFADLRSRRTKTKAETLQKQKHKNRLSNHYDEDNRFFTFNLTMDMINRISKYIITLFVHSFPSPFHLLEVKTSVNLIMVKNYIKSLQI